MERVPASEEDLDVDGASGSGMELLPGGDGGGVQLPGVEGGGGGGGAGPVGGGGGSRVCFAARGGGGGLHWRGNRDRTGFNWSRCVSNPTIEWNRRLCVNI
jgi:hypothetical protein